MRTAIVPPVAVPYREPLFERLAARGHLVSRVIYQSESQPGIDQRRDWFPTHHDYDSVSLHSRQRARAGRPPIVFPRGLGRALDELDPECVVSWECGPATWRSIAWCRRRGRPLVIFSELTPQAAAALSPVQQRIHRWCARRAAGFIAASSAARERLLALGAAPDAVEVSLQSADVKAFRAAASERRADGRPVRVLAVGRLVPDKNLALLIEAFGETGLGDSAELQICGTGPLERELRDLAERLGVPARFLGYVAPAELPRVYAEADVLALVSTWEPFGAAVREAVAAGMPVICTKVAGAAGDLAIDGRNAVLVDPSDRRAVGAALTQLATDAELRERMGRESQAVTSETDPERSVEAFERAVVRAARS